MTLLMGTDYLSA